MIYLNIINNGTSGLLVPPGKIQSEGYNNICVAFLIKKKKNV